MNVLAATAIGLGEDEFGDDSAFGGEDDANEGLERFLDSAERIQNLENVARDPVGAAWNGFVDGAFRNIQGGDALTAAVPGAETDLLTTMVGEDGEDGGDSLSSFVEADGGGMLKWTQVQNALRTLPPTGKQHFGAPLMKTKPAAPPAPGTVKR
jgi:hypothetical protein